jgi:hypothetical protein
MVTGVHALPDVAMITGIRVRSVKAIIQNTMHKRLWLVGNGEWWRVIV